MKPDYILETNAGQFYSGNGYVECPRCHASFRLDALPLVVLASDAMADFCPECRLFVVVNMMSGGVIFEGFKRSEDQDRRLLELSGTDPASAPKRKLMSGEVIFEGFKRSEDQDRRLPELSGTGPTSAPKRKLWWRFW